MIHLSQTVIVEGKYDAVRLAGILDCNILTTNGFRVFSDREKQVLIRNLAEKSGIILLTDSDRAGFRIRGFLSGLVKPEQLTQVYIPRVEGKEPRKSEPSREGTLGVEGIREDVLLECFRRAGITPDSSPAPSPADPITSADLMELGLSGGEGASCKRRALCDKIGFPPAISSKALLRCLNLLYTKDELISLVRAL